MTGLDNSKQTERPYVHSGPAGKIPRCWGN